MPGISERYLTQLESGKGNVSVVLLRQVAEALGLPLSRLVEERRLAGNGAGAAFLSRLTPAQLHDDLHLADRMVAADANRPALSASP